MTSFVAVRGGGHNGPGFGTVDRGMVIDLLPRHHVEADVPAITVERQRHCRYFARAMVVSRGESGLA
jgi:hypothetical protein